MNKQLMLLDEDEPLRNTTTFVDNMALPVHRWFRYSAGFSAKWVESVIEQHIDSVTPLVLDPFAGSATTLLAAEDQRINCVGVESHPFISRVARAKLCRQHDPQEFVSLASEVLKSAKRSRKGNSPYPDLIQRCFSEDHLDELDRLRRAYQAVANDSVESQLVWLTLVSILRKTSHAGTAQWQYVLPNKTKKRVANPFDAFSQFAKLVVRDMESSQQIPSLAKFVEGDARTCEGVEDRSIGLVVTSPPYPNNYDYADATRFEMMFMREIEGWADLQSSVRQYLVRSCSQHTTKKTTDLDTLLNSEEVLPIAGPLRDVVREMAVVRETKGGKKNYHLMVAAYFYDLSRVWQSLRRVCDSPSRVCFVIGDSAPYGVYVPVVEWMGSLAIAAGFSDWKFEKMRDRNIKWKNRKHRVPLCEGHLWVEG